MQQVSQLDSALLVRQVAYSYQFWAAKYVLENETPKEATRMRLDQLSQRVAKSKDSKVEIRWKTLLSKIKEVGLTSDLDDHCLDISALRGCASLYSIWLQDDNLNIDLPPVSQFADIIRSAPIKKSLQEKAVSVLTILLFLHSETASSDPILVN